MGFFHRKAENRKRKNLLQGLYDENGSWCEDDAGVERIVSSYFTKMFTASELDFEAMDTTISAIQSCVSQEMNEELCRPYSGEEIKCALFQMYPTKSPINFTHVCLIPKVNNPENMSDLRPIALRNVIHKLCSKAIANRLKVISASQSAFVPGRLITDNILVANEMAHFIHNKREVRYSFLVRGKQRGVVTPSRVLRKGDPLSPYLFLIGAEGFSALLQMKQRDGLLSGIELCRDAPSVNHLLFADDSMLYAKCRFGGLLSDTRHYIQEEVSSLLGVENVDSHEKYLGLPTYVGREKTSTFQYIKDNLAKKLKNWQGKLLCGAGKDILIRVVAQALPTFAISVFQLTKCLCEDLEQMCARFWWGSSLEKRKIHW
ncbi:uncharacterized protein LOC133711206 [Rosa rugosa]|uniref:uncharacterized protein LOC133711206 n=1 Tax=Rosa rugosa TaxID=74645 RepID=UPI002B406DB7|nr:uncharacterized protein LOC133711206 [Rosa rugosa]